MTTLRKILRGEDGEGDDDGLRIKDRTEVVMYMTDPKIWEGHVDHERFPATIVPNAPTFEKIRSRDGNERFKDLTTYSNFLDAEYEFSDGRIGRCEYLAVDNVSICLEITKPASGSKGKAQSKYGVEYLALGFKQETFVSIVDRCGASVGFELDTKIMGQNNEDGYIWANVNYVNKTEPTVRAYKKVKSKDGKKVKGPYKEVAGFNHKPAYILKNAPDYYTGTVLLKLTAYVMAPNDVPIEDIEDPEYKLSMKIGGIILLDKENPHRKPAYISRSYNPLEHTSRKDYISTKDKSASESVQKKKKTKKPKTKIKSAFNHDEEDEEEEGGHGGRGEDDEEEGKDGEDDPSARLFGGIGGSPAKSVKSTHDS